MRKDNPYPSNNGSAVACLLAAGFLLLSPPAVAAQDSTIVGTLTLASTFNCVSVRASFTGDVNATNNAAVEYRVTGSGTWLKAYPPVADRRTTISGSANPYVNQFRGSIVGLRADTSYDIRLTVADTDGVSGGPTLFGTVVTLASTPPLGGMTWYVDDVTVDGDGSSASPFNTIARGVAAASAGDTVYIRAGIYPAFTLSKSGTEAAWIALVGEDRDTTFISGSTTDLTISANYVQVKNLRFHKPTTSGTTQGTVIAVGRSQHDIWLENLHFEDLPLPEGGSSYANAVVNVGWNSHHVYILNSRFHAPSLASKPDRDYNTGGFGVLISALAAEGTLVVKGNVLDGKFQDAVGGTPETYGYGQWGNSDVCDNTISGFTDDGIQTEGDDINLRIWGNTITVDHGWSALAQQTAYVGPLYVFRNVLIGTSRDGSIFKSDRSAYVFCFHNTIDASASTNNTITGATVNWVARNNIFRGSNYSILYGPGGLSSGSFDYDLYYPNTNVCSSYPSTLADWKAAVTGQEMHAPNPADPLFTNSAKHIDATSPAYNAGVVVPNFNDATSAWPYVGAAPDIGAYEVGRLPVAPANVVIR